MNEEKFHKELLALLEYMQTRGDHSIEMWFALVVAARGDETAVKNPFIKGVMDALKTRVDSVVEILNAGADSLDKKEGKDDDILLRAAEMIRGQA